MRGHKHHKGLHEPSRKSGGRTIEAPGLVADFMARELSRRAILKGALASSAAAMGGALLGCGSDRPPAGSPDAGVGTDGGAADAVAPRVEHLVGMGYSEVDYFEALDLALAETIGLSLIQPGQTVYFKVNCNNGDAYPHSTKPELIVELVRRMRDLGATRFIVGDRSFWGDDNTLGNMTRNGVAGAAMDAGAELVVFDETTVDWVAISEADAPNWVGGFRLPVPVMEADHIINLPCVKTHFIATFTMSLKNSLGIVNPTDRARTGNLNVHEYPRLWPQIAQVARAITPSLNILDGYRALITGGPTRFDPPGPSYADPLTIVVSTDRVATDVTGIAILQTLSPDTEEVTRTSAWSNDQIYACAGAGIGIASPDLYDLSGPSVPRIDEYRDLATRA